MAFAMREGQSESLSKGVLQSRALRILAKSTYRELKSSGYNRLEILAFATEMLALVSQELKEEAHAGESGGKGKSIASQGREEQASAES
ncbi:MAG: hypothetical protein N2515_05615 [Deltaproteobacteria bacterium]|nr:hypothetical protein [Deltaproteobacteria bacterium]